MTQTDEIAVLRDTLRKHGLHVTPARVAVLRVLRDLPGHHSVEEIRTAVLAHYPALDPVTVYRTLEQFEVCGLAVSATLGDKLTRWEKAGPAHHHLICRACGVVLELDPSPFARLAAELEDAYGIRVEPRHLALRGLCPDCTRSAA